MKQSLDATTVSARQTAAAMRTLPAQFTDIATQLAGGQNPLLILLQQGGQIKDSFGGIGPAVRAIASTISVTSVAVGGLAIAAGSVVAAFAAGEAQSTAFNRALALSGNQAGLTAGQFEVLVGRIRETGDMTQGAARDIAQAAIESGQFGARSVQAATQAMAELQRVSGRSAAEVVKEFGNMRQGVAAWAQEKDRAYNFLTPEVLRLIRAMEEQGDVEGAIVAATNAFSASMQERTVRLGYLERAWKAVKGAASSGWDALAGIGREETADERLAKAQQRLEDLRANQAGARSDNRSRYQPGIDAAQAEVDILMTAKRAEEERATAAAEAAREKERELLLEKQRVALIGPSAALQLAQVQATSQARIATIEAEQRRLEQMRASGALSEQEFADESLAVTRRKVGEEIALIQRRIAIEKGTEITTGDPVQQAVAQKNREVKLAQMAGELAAARAKLGAAESESAIETIKRSRVEADKQFTSLTSFYEQTRNAVRQFAADNETARIALIRDPVARENAEIDKQIADIELKYGDLAQSIRQKIIAALATGNDQLAADLRAQLTALEAEMAKARGNAAARRPDDPNDMLLGFRRGMEDLQKQSKGTGQIIRESIGNAFESASDALADFVTTGKFNFRSFAASVLADLAKMIARQAVFNAIKAAAGYFGFADGGAFEAGRQAFASGGVVTRPTPFRFAAGGTMRNGLMGEAGPEAIMPLRRTASGRLGVEVAGGAGAGGTSVVVNVNVESGETTVQSEGARAAQLGRSIGAVVRQTIIQEQRPGGLLAAA
ncbi:MAG: phage tail length tape measure family protein [Burkholderiaceae bacterium]|nr:phage tail length tape measure family protein [Burkholderiaceae bacterium]